MNLANIKTLMLLVVMNCFGFSAYSQERNTYAECFENVFSKTLNEAKCQDIPLHIPLWSIASNKACISHFMDLIEPLVLQARRQAQNVESRKVERTILEARKNEIHRQAANRTIDSTKSRVKECQLPGNIEMHPVHFGLTYVERTQSLEFKK